MDENYKFIISYDGTRYSGWQSQGNTGSTIQGIIENVLNKMLNYRVDLIGAGRTDAGVHALEMVANAHFTTDLSEKEIQNYLNKYLPADICISRVTKVSSRFHSRYNATGKIYRYTCYTGNSKPIFDRNYVYILESVPDIGKMQLAATFLTGTQDFTSFCGNKKFNKSPVRTIYSVEIEKKEDHIIFTYHGNGFLQNMVRIITGTLLEIGYGKTEPESIRTIIESKDRKTAGAMAPASGLCLIKVEYEQ